MILVKAAAGLVLELATGESGRLDCLSLRLAEGISARPFRFQVEESATGRLMARPLENHELSEMVAALGALLRSEENILAELRKYT